MTYLISIFLYLVILLTIGIILAGRIRNREDFMVAGRRLTAPVLVGTLLATWIGSGDIFSVADLSYHHGYSSLIGSAGGWLGIIIVYFIAARVRRFAQFTVPDILEARYDHRVRILATVTTVIAYVTIVSYQLRGGGWVIQMITNGAVSTQWSYLFMTLFIIVYTLTAGMLSVAYLDMINGCIIIGGVLTAIPFLIHHAGGLDLLSRNLPLREHVIFGNMTPVAAMGYFVPTFLLALGNANMYQRFFSARDEREAKRSVIGWVIGVMIIGFCVQTLAVVGSSIFRGLSTSESGKIILLVAFKGVPVLVGCILMASITAIIISTANSFLLVPATNVMRDIVQRFFKPDISDRSMVLGSRLTLVILGCCAYGLIGFFPRILHAAYAAYTIYGAGLTPALMATFFWRRATARGALASILAGMLITAGWEIATRWKNGPVLGIPAVYPALFFSVVFLIAVSLLDRPPDGARVRPFL